MAKGLFDLLIDSVFDEEWVGRRGEKLTERELKLVKLFGRKGKILRNIYVPKRNGEMSEIDVVYITQKGIFVFESKNYSGWIFGDEADSYWTVMLSNHQKNRFYNPVKQNRTHLKWLKEYVGDGIPLYSIIVFSERCELKKVTVRSNDVIVIKRDLTYATVRNIWDSHEDVVEDVDGLYEKLKVLTNVDKAVRTAHAEAITRRFGPDDRIQTDKNIRNKPYEDASIKKGSAMAKNDQGLSEAKDQDATNKGNGYSEDNSPEIKAVQSMICPWCGKELVLRTAKQGVHAGRQFYGCSGFPNCRYLRNM